MTKELARNKIPENISKQEILNDYRIANESRQVSLMGRREVLTGKAKFGIFGDGKEIPQLAMAKVFQKGDWRSGYYRDQTFMFASGMMKLEEFFAQLYGDTDQNFNPGTAGRLMNNHFSVPFLDQDGNWLNQTLQKNSAADTSPTASQMPRLLGLALASKVYRNVNNLDDASNFSTNGNEVAFGTIGDASTSEGQFFETVNAAGVLQVPMAISVWDDGWGISVPNKYQTTKESISEILKGFEKTKDKAGILIYTAKGWDYPGLVKMYQEGIDKCRTDHVPVLFHITEVTQPQGHSTSGSHERYKTKVQLQKEKDLDGIMLFRNWILDENIATADELNKIETNANKRAKEAKKNAWNNFQKPIKEKQKEFLNIVDITNCSCTKTDKINEIKSEISKIGDPIYKDLMSSGKKILRHICNSCSNPNNSFKIDVTKWLAKEMVGSIDKYHSHLNSESSLSVSHIEAVSPSYKEDAQLVPGREILKLNFDHIFENIKEAMIFGEDVGKIGGVNQSLEGLQKKYGDLRISDTGIREATIIGQGIGMAMRGLRPIAEIQYFDYLLYGLQLLSDDLSTLLYRTRGTQKAPLIVRTRGHRLEGIWHSGSPLSMVINSVRGMNLLVPRNMTQAAGFYNTMLASDEPAIIIEPLNAYRIKERLPSNFGTFKIKPGAAEILIKGNDITLVTYGSCVRIAEDAVNQLKDFDINVELIDVQSLLPFDNNHSITKSIKKTAKVLFFDEDVPGGATAYMMQKVLDEQNAFCFLDAEPRTLTAQAHRAAYSTDGDYFSNPNAEDVFDSVYNMMHEYHPEKYPKIF
ncbi:MAG: transketolase [Bacteroidetes bacterium]|nr:transketolase [Bacteroidota bacterium]